MYYAPRACEDHPEPENAVSSQKLADAIHAWEERGTGNKEAWSGKLAKPCEGRVTSIFGLRRHPVFKTSRLHPGIDISAREGTPIYSAAEGTVVFADWMGGYGNTVQIYHGGGRSMVYCHMSCLSVAVGEVVGVETEIGQVGSTGNSTAPHLHFELRIDGQPVDPALEGSIDWLSPQREQNIAQAG